MSGKVKCTCGWSWNKSDSSKKDMYICHECGRDNSNNMKNGGWLDNYGEEENANDSSVSLPEGYVGEGIFNGPIFENPAVKGQFQMGGNIPGAVGHMYARTGSPSKGPRRNQTDVTDASAQNGKEMQYYQQGLDWKPKTISKDGAWLDQYDVAQAGKFINKRGVELQLKEYKDVQKDSEKLHATGKLDNPRSVLYKQNAPKQEEVRKHIPQSKKSKAWEIATHPTTAFGYAVRNEELPDHFSKGAINAHEQAVDIINPFFYADQSGQFVKNVATGHPVDATINALSVIPAAAEFAPELRMLGKGISNAARETGALASDLTKARSVKEAVGRMAGLPIEGSLPRLSPEELKMFRQVQEVGRLRATGKPISEQYKYALEQKLPEEHLQKVFGKSKKEIENAIPNAQEEEAFRLANPIRDRINLERPPRPSRQSASTAQQLDRDRLRAMMRGWDEDINAGRSTISNADLDIPTTSIDPNEAALSELMADVPSSFQDRISAIRQQNETAINTNASTNLDDLFAALDAGTHSTQTNRLANNDIINSMRSNVITEHGPQKVENFIEQGLAPMQNASNKLKTKFINSVQDYPYYEGPIMENVPSLHLRGSGSLKDVSNKVATTSTEGIGSGDVFTGSLNTSHSSYLPQLKQVFKYDEGAPQFFGYKPMNDLGFLSDYRYSKDDIAKYLNTEIDAQIKRGILPKNIQRPFVKGEQVQLPHYGVKQFREGGVIKDDRGQWDHPGEITEIGSNKITMKGVPYNVIGVSDTGDVKMMRPGKDYKFKGKKVTEYPMAKNGVNQQDQKTLQQLDQLTNFTNYNKPQPGGWLNKYKS